MRALIPTMLSLSLIACEEGGADPKDPHAPDPDRVARQITSADGDVGEVVAGNSAFAWALYGELVDGDDNLFFSPFSISAALGMTSAGARGETATEMSQVLDKRVPEASWHSAFGDLTDDLNGDKARGYRLEVANRLFGQADYDFKPDFLATCEENWRAPLEEVDWRSDFEAGRDRVNEWVADRTEDRIPELLPEGSVDSDTRLVLANAIYFLADWWTQFDTADTRDHTFTRQDGSEVTVDMMWLRTGEIEDHRVTGRLSDDGSAGIARLPYVDDEVSAYLVVPTDLDGLPAIEAQLTAGWFDDILQGLGTPDSPGSAELWIGLPKFEMRWKKSIKPALEALGMEAVFGAADLTGIADVPGEPLYLVDVFHEAWIRVDEEGTEAAAATGAVVGVESAPIFDSVVADRPFLLVVRDDLTGSLLFVTRVMDPTAEE